MKELCAFQPRRYWPGRWDKLEMTEPPSWLLLFLGTEPSGRPMDLARIELGMFLIDRQILEPSGQFYCFDAFENGPVSIEVHPDLQWLRLGRLIEKMTLSPREVSYALTDAGREVYACIAQGKTPAQRKAVQEIAAFVSSHSVSEVLARIFQEYPEYAISSVPLAATGD